MKTNNIPTPHINAKEHDFAKVVLMPGDPLRAKFIADNFLSDVKEINTVRNMLGYTGKYKNKTISIMAHGMGNPSIGIYSYELFKFYNVETIIRIGSCGTFKNDIELGDIIIAKKALSNSSYASCMNVSLDEESTLFSQNENLIKKLEDILISKNIKYFLGSVISSDAFYGETNGNYIDSMIKNGQILGIEMEAFALYANAKKLNKNALTILTVSDSLVSKKEMTSLERQTSFKNMMESSLDLAISLIK